MKPYAILVATVLLTSGTPRVASAVTLPDALTAQAQESLAIANNTTIMAKLLTNVDATQAKVDDAVNAEATEDVKEGHDVLLRKGSTFNGHIMAVQRFGPDKPCVVAILFDKATIKGGEQVFLNVNIQALATPVDVKSDSLASGRGMDQTANDAEYSPTVRATDEDGRTIRLDSKVGTVDGLSHKSVGIYGLAHVSLGYETTKAGCVSTVTSSASNLRLKKGMQVVVKVVAQ
jgi:hypothetical protein